MPDDLSQQDVQDLQDIAARLPKDDPRLLKIHVLLSSKKSVIPPVNPINQIFSKATSIGPAPSILDRLRAGQVPGLDEFQQGAQSVEGQNLPPQSGMMAKIGQLAGVLTKSPASQALAGTIAPEAVPSGSQIGQDWQAINEAIGATKTSVRIPKSATSIEEAVTIPARGLVKEGLNLKTISKMNPIEQQAAIFPKWNAAGQAIDKSVIDATAKNITLNPSESALKVVSSITNPTLQQKAIEQLDSLMSQVGIQDASKTTPLEALQLRRALRAGARFGPNGDLNSLGSIRSQLYNAVSDDLKGSIEGFAELDQHYSDLTSALKAANNSASKGAVKTDPSLLEKYGPTLAREVAKGLGVGTGVGSLYGLYRIMKEKGMVP